MLSPDPYEYKTHKDLLVPLCLVPNPIINVKIIEFFGDISIILLIVWMKKLTPEKLIPEKLTIKLYFNSKYLEFSG
jgi:hypothetical protein